MQRSASGYGNVTERNIPSIGDSLFPAGFIAPAGKYPYRCRYILQFNGAIAGIPDVSKTKWEPVGLISLNLSDDSGNICWDRMGTFVGIELEHLLG